MKKMKFKIGDIITGITERKYSFTNNRAIMKVIAVSGRCINIIVQDFPDESIIGREYKDLQPRYFKLIKHKKITDWEKEFI